MAIRLIKQTMENPFKSIEPDAVCPPHLKTELVSEIDLVRNALQVVELYSDDLFATVIGFLSGVVGENGK